jgi:hypothetical protein
MSGGLFSAVNSLHPAVACTEVIPFNWWEITPVLKICDNSKKKKNKLLNDRD